MKNKTLILAGISCLIANKDSFGANVSNNEHANFEISQFKNEKLTLSNENFSENIENFVVNL
jgi:hypothetical protein